MRRIVKLQAPVDLAEFVKKEKPQKFEQIHKSKLYPNLYRECVVKLEAEQDGLSGYTEKPLSKDIHVDHYRRQALFNSPSMVFGWENMIADEHNSSYGADFKDKHVKKQSDYAKLINPVVEDPHHYLTYMDEGIIKPVDGLDKDEREKAEFTILTFNLNHNLLNERRRHVIELVKEYKSQGLTADEISGALHDYGFTSAVEYALQA